MSKSFGFIALGLCAAAALWLPLPAGHQRIVVPDLTVRVVQTAPDAIVSEGIGALPPSSRRLRIPPAGGASLPPSVEVIVHDPTLVYRQEIALLRRRIAWLETELDLCGSEVTRGPVGRWLAVLQPDERPAAPTLRLVAEYLRPYPVELTIEEGLWVAARVAADDWGPLTVDEALIRFLGPARLLRELPPHIGAELRADWAGEGLFAE